MNKSSWRDLLIDMVVDKFIFKIYQITLSPSYTFITKIGVWDYLPHTLNTG